MGARLAHIRETLGCFNRFEVNHCSDRIENCDQFFKGNNLCKSSLIGVRCTKAINECPRLENETALCRGRSLVDDCQKVQTWMGCDSYTQESTYGCFSVAERQQCVWGQRCATPPSPPRPPPPPQWCCPIIEFQQAPPSTAFPATLTRVSDNLWSQPANHTEHKYHSRR